MWRGQAREFPAERAQPVRGQHLPLVDEARHERGHGRLDEEREGRHARGDGVDQRERVG